MNATTSLDYKVLSLLSAKQAHQLRLVPFMEEDNRLFVFAELDRQRNCQKLSLIKGKQVEAEIVGKEELDRLLHQYYPQKKSASLKENEVADAEGSDVVKFVNKVFKEAVDMQASDIHLERYAKEARIRFRWEGQLIEKYQVALDQYNALVSRIKILSELDISERRLPQDGRIHMSLGEQELDVRVSIIPGKYGEKVVMRLLMRNEAHLQLNHLPFDDSQRAAYMSAIQQPNGMILITGPTGSGKTTTLYATLNELNQANKNLLTIEDPIEYNLSGINQVQVKEEIGLTFDKTLRAFLRQDPDIIMVGEVRDEATASIAIRAALTGHLVFSTLHTNSAWDAITRLMDMGIEPYLLAASLRLVVAQRLVRKLCPHCKLAAEDIMAPGFQKKYAIKSHYIPQGCQHCHYTGYTGRMAIFEVLPIVGQLVEMIKGHQQVNWEELKFTRMEDRLGTLAREGSTSLAEVLQHVETK